MEEEQIKLKSWKLMGDNGRYELVLLAKVSENKRDFSLALVCSKTIYLLDDDLFSEFDQEFIPELWDELSANGMENISALDLLRSGIISDVYDKLLEYNFIRGNNSQMMRIGPRSRPVDAESSIDSGTPVIMTLNVMSKMKEYMSSLFSRKTEEEEDAPEEENENIDNELEEDPQEDLAEEDNDDVDFRQVPESELHQEESMEEIPEDNNEDNEVGNDEDEVNEEENIEEIEEMSAQKATNAIAVPDELDKLTSDAALISRNIKKIVDLQRLGQYTNLQEQQINELQAKVDELKNQLAQTLLWM